MTRAPGTIAPAVLLMAMLLPSLVAVGACAVPAGPAPAAHEVRIPIDPGGPTASAAPLVLAGTLTVPPSTTAARRPPVALLLGGSGPQDRDGARADLPGYRPWPALADTLAAHGVALLRLDDRGTGASGGRFAGTTTLDFARDAAQVVAWLRRSAVVDGRRVALIGHSEGALVALLVAAGDRRVQALALLGAPSRPGRELARWQRQALVSRDLAAFPPPERGPVLAAAEAEAERVAERDPWVKTWFALDPRAVARQVHRPVLLLHGETDQQVPVGQVTELAAALRAGGAAVRVVRLPRTDHLFLEDDDGDPAGYVRLPDQRLRPAALGTIAAFLAGGLGAH